MRISFPTLAFFSSVAAGACLIIYVIRSISTHVFNLSGVLRPLIFLLLIYTLASWRINSSAIIKIFVFILLVSVLQLVFILSQVFLGNNVYVVYLSRIFSSQDMLGTFATYSRATGFFGGPAPSGVFVIIAILSAYYLKAMNKIGNIVLIIIFFSLVAQSFFMFSKASLFFCLAFILRYASLSLFSRFTSRRASLLYVDICLFTLALLFSLVIFQADLSALRTSDGFLKSLSYVFDLSSFDARLGYHGANVFLVGDFYEMLFGSSRTIGGSVYNRVFDSDLLYFCNIYGIAGFCLLVGLFAIYLYCCALLQGGLFLSILSALIFFVNPFFSSLLPLPFIVLFLLASVSLVRQHRLRFRASSLSN